MPAPQDKISRLPRIARFALVGGANTLCYAAVAFSLTGLFDVSALPASATGFTCSAILSYIGHRNFTFGSEGNHAREAPRFIALTFCACAVALAVPAICRFLGMPAFVAILATCVLIPAANYLLMGRTVFVDATRQSR